MKEKPKFKYFGYSEEENTYRYIATNDEDKVKQLKELGIKVIEFKNGY